MNIGFDEGKTIGIPSTCVYYFHLLYLPGVLTPGVKQPRSGADHPPPSSAEVGNAWSYTSNSPVRAWYLIEECIRL
jgi:hypothetical protein